MLVLSYILHFVSWLVSVYIFLIVVYALMSWLPGAYQSRLGQLIGRLVEPFLSYFDFLQFGGLGFGPVAGIIVLTLVQYGLTAISSWLPAMGSF